MGDICSAFVRTKVCSPPIEKEELKKKTNKAWEKYYLDIVDRSF
jgi:hypothetical protein